MLWQFIVEGTIRKEKWIRVPEVFRWGPEGGGFYCGVGGVIILVERGSIKGIEREGKRKGKEKRFLE